MAQEHSPGVQSGVAEPETAPGNLLDQVPEGPRGRGRGLAFPAPGGGFTVWEEILS